MPTPTDRPSTNKDQLLKKTKYMKPVVSIIMGSTSDLPVMEKAAKLLDEMQVPFEMNALSAHRTPAEVEKFAKEAAGRGIKVIIHYHCRNVLCGSGVLFFW